MRGQCGRLRRPGPWRSGYGGEFDFEPRDHVELGRLLGAIDLDRGAKVSGSRFYYLTGAGADLELLGRDFDEAVLPLEVFLRGLDAEPALERSA